MTSNNTFHLSATSMFNDQVTLGLLTVLRNTPNVRNLTVEPRLPCDQAKIDHWERQNACTLPDDVKAFYASCDGFKLTWSYKIEGVMHRTTTADSAPSSLPIGNITVNPLSDLNRLCDIKSDSVDIHVIHNLQLLDVLSDNDEPKFTGNSKIFELDKTDVGHVCLVYTDDQAAAAATSRPEFCLREERSNASVWLLDTSYCWHFLAPNFSNYFRKSLVHMGLTHWQLKFTDMGLTSISVLFMNLVAPHLNATVEVPAAAIGSTDDDDDDDDDGEHIVTAVIDTSEPNHFDPSVLKTAFNESTTIKRDLKSTGI